MVSVNATSVMPSAPPASSPSSDQDACGTASDGNPRGSAPTSFTPCAARSNSHVAAIATTATSTPGSFGSHRCSTRISARLTTPIATAAPTASPAATPCTNPFASPIRPSPSTENPNSFGSWLTRMVSASPFRYPIWVGLDSRSATNPSRATPATAIMTPTSNASIDARATARPGSPPEATSGSTTAAIIGPSEESGPRTRIRYGPKTAYPSRQKMDV